MKKITILTLCLFLSLAQAETNEYKINPGDILEISVWQEEDLQRELRVLPDGTISFPLVGIIKASEKSSRILQNEITTILSAFITEPIVSVFVKESAGNAVYVLGKVKAPGKFVMHQPMNVMQILSIAGGLTVFANANNILIFRRNKDSFNTFKFEYDEVKDGDELDKNIFLKGGDVIVVP